MTHNSEHTIIHKIRETLNKQVPVKVWHLIALAVVTAVVVQVI